LKMQRKYWQKKGYISEKQKFFGYDLTWVNVANLQHYLQKYW
jgi:hypothetical protein